MVFLCFGRVKFFVLGSLSKFKLVFLLWRIFFICLGSFVVVLKVRLFLGRRICFFFVFLRF